MRRKLKCFAARFLENVGVLIDVLQIKEVYSESLNKAALEPFSNTGECV